MAIHRVIVRGCFDRLDDQTVARLRARQGDHDVVESAFTAEGTLVYGPDLGAFTWRFEVRTTGDEPDPTEHDAAVRIGTERAVVRLDRMGVGYKRLRAVGSDMADVWKR